MYIGRLGTGNNPDDGIFVLLKEVVANAVDEFIMGCGERITVAVKGGSVSVRDKSQLGDGSITNRLTSVLVRENFVLW